MGGGGGGGGGGSRRVRTGVMVSVYNKTFALHLGLDYSN